MIKTNVNDLALLGGKPIYEKPLHVGKPNLGDRDSINAMLDDIFDRLWLTNNGRYVQNLEKEIAKILDVKHCIAVCNGTIGLQLAFAAAGLQGEVIVPSFTFIGTVHALQWQGLTPVFCDVRPEDHTIDPEKIEELITENTSAILGVHLWGQACEIEKLQQIADQHNLVLIFDSAHAFMCSYHGKMLGGFGDAEVFSFHATKFFNTVEGGAVTTNDDALAERLRQLRNFGFDGHSFDNIVNIGINGKMNEISAAIGLANLESIDRFVEINRSNYDKYRELFSKIQGIDLLEYNPDERNNYQYVVAIIDQAKSNIRRDTLLDILHAEKILARRYFYPGCHNVPPYHERKTEIDSRMGTTNFLIENVLCFPTGPSITFDDIETIAALINFVFENSVEINRSI